MNFEAFQKQARLYVLGALDPAEMKEFEDARKQFGQKAEDSIRDSQALCEAFALSLRPAESSAALKERLMSMICRRQQPA